MRVRALVALHADTAHREHARRQLERRSDFAELRVLGPLGRLVSAEEPHGEPRPWKRLLVDETRRQAERPPDLADFVFVELHERLDDFPGLDPPQQLGNAIMVRLDERGFTRATRLDRVGIDRALPEQPFTRRKMFEHVVLDREKCDADALALDLGIRLRADRTEKVGRCIAKTHILEPGLLVRRHHIRGFVLPHEAGVDVHAMHAIFAERIRTQLVRDRRIDAAADEEQHLLRRTHARANVRLDRVDRIRG